MGKAVDDAVSPASGGAFAWVSDLGSAERRAFVACVGGWALDAMDVQMFSFAISASFHFVTLPR